MSDEAQDELEGSAEDSAAGSAEQERGWMRPLDRLPYLAFGLGLFAIKIALDYAVSRAFEQPYSVLYYVSPSDAPLLSPGGRELYYLAMWAVALPFIAVGLWLTARRLRSAGLPVWLGLLFFVPFANLLFFAAAAVVPEKDQEPKPKAEGYRERASRPPRVEEKGFFAAALMAGAGGAVVALGMVALSVGLFREYGAALFLGAPAISGHVATLLFCRLHEPKISGAMAATAIALFLSLTVMIAFAIEGLVCLIMAAPLWSFSALLGMGIAYAFVSLVRRDPGKRPPRSIGGVAAVLPIFLLAEVFSPLPEGEQVVESALVIQAPPEAVWQRVLAFEELPEPEELIFRMGVSAPTGAVISGEGVGAVRRCRFTTGEFVEPITVWRPGRELSFGVERQPDPMREMTPWPGPRPPHLDGFLQTTRGQFLLVGQADGTTLLRGRTWYTLDMAPRRYWVAWSDYFIHQIHLRVMRQIKRLAEEDHQAAQAAREARPGGARYATLSR